MNKIINIDLPFFSGFCESDYENGDTAYCAIREEVEYSEENYGEKLTEDDFDYDYNRRREDIINQFISVFKDYAPDFVLNVTLEKLQSPKYYNYSTDKIFADIELSENWVNDFKTFIESHKDILEDRINKDWSSRSGFVSFVDNHLDDFCTHLFNEEDRDQDMYIGIMLAYIMDISYDESKSRHSEELYYAILMDVLYDIYDGSYVFRVKKDEE